MIRPGLHGMVPRTADEMASYFKASTYGQLNRSSINSYHNLYVNKPDLKIAYETNATSEHERHAPHSQSYTLSIPLQVQAVMHRRWQILKGDRVTQAVQIGFVLHIGSAVCWRLICHKRLEPRFSRLSSSGLCFSKLPRTRVHTFRGVVFSSCMDLLC